jgi:phospholipid-transporting ATPase
LVKYVQAFLINVDLDIYYPETDTPAVCRTSSLVEELGQIEYIFSDKTGTLTCNMMQFRQASIGGIQYGEEVAEDRKARVVDGVEDGVFDFKRLRENIRGQNGYVIKEFLTLLATCHTVIPERNDEKPTEINYQAASPDEGALVEGAAMLGYKFTTRRPKSVSVQIDDEGEKEYEVLNVCHFTMSRWESADIL